MLPHTIRILEKLGKEVLNINPPQRRDRSEVVYGSLTAETLGFLGLPPLAPLI